MRHDDRHVNILRVYLILSCIGSLFGFVALLIEYLQAGSGDQAAAPGIWIVALPGIVGVVSLYLAVLSYRPSAASNMIERLDRFLLSRFGFPVTFLIFFYISIFSLIYSMSASPAIYGPVYPVGLVPFFVWLAFSSGLALTFLVIWRVGVTRSVLIGLPAGIAILVLGVGVCLQFWGFEAPRKEDIYFIYLDGERLLQGMNPYERVLAGDMRVNDKYSTYLPGFYYLSWMTQVAGLQKFEAWLSFWRGIFLAFNLSIAALLFYLPARRGLLGFSVFAALFWLFNRWTLHVARTADLDFIALFFLLLSLYLFGRNRIASLLILGLSLTIKQVAIFVVPVYLIWSWKSPSEMRVKHLFSAAFWIGIIPLLASLPFLISNAEAFIRSILFSATRVAAAAFNVYSLDVALGWQGILARLPILVMLLLLYWLAWKYNIAPFSLALLVLAVFVFFNSVFYTSYMVWLVALIPLAVYELLAQFRDGSTA